MKILSSCFSLARLVALCWLCLGDAALAAPPKVGDRLPPAAAAADAKAAWRTLEWDDLMPKDWDPAAPLKGLDFSQLNDGDPRAEQALAKLKAAWDEAPTNPQLDGVRVRLAGFIVPLERQGERVTELLLVPYFGACIHVPPPPANQVVHVLLQRPLKNARTMDAFWVKGVLSRQRGDGGGMGEYGYRLIAEEAEPYRYPKNP